MCIRDRYESVVEKYSEGGSYKKKFGVSTQHYSFAVKAFVDMVQKFDVSEYEFAIRETKTADVISDVSTMKSEVCLLYTSTDGWICIKQNQIQRQKICP